VHIRESGVEREYGEKEALTPSLFLIIIAGAVGATTVPLHTPFSDSGIVSASFSKSEE
jgi:hypothetical protein